LHVGIVRAQINAFIQTLNGNHVSTLRVDGRREFGK
jgi:hypothetical protein